MVIKIKKGLDIKLKGEAEKVTQELNASLYAIKPTDFTGVLPKLSVKEGDVVKAGSTLFFDKYRDYLRFSSPVSGRVKEIRRGAKRVILEIVVEPDGKNEKLDFGKMDIYSSDRESLTQRML